MIKITQDFHAFTVKFNGRTNVLICDVGVSQAFDPMAIRVNQPQIKYIKSIWDTGATSTVISKRFASELGLIPTGKVTITGVNNTTEENTYFVNIYLPNKVNLMFVKIAEVPGVAGDADMLVGMDIIGAGDFSVYSEEGKTVMTYRLPSVGGVDFCLEAERIKSQRELMQGIQDHKVSNNNSRGVKKSKRRKNHIKKHKNKHKKH